MKISAAAFIVVLGLLVGHPSFGASQDAEPTARAASLNGWGPYKFGMSIDQVRQIAGSHWAQVSLANSALTSGYSASLYTDGIDQFGTHFKMVDENFDDKGQLSSVTLLYSHVVPAVDECKRRFESLLLTLEQQYGEFRPSDDLSNALVRMNYISTTHGIPGGNSHYRDIAMSNFQSELFSPNSRLFILAARRIIGSHFVQLSMNFGTELKAFEVPDEVLAADPMLAKPTCGINVSFVGSEIDPSAALATASVLANAPEGVRSGNSTLEHVHSDVRDSEVDPDFSRLRLINISVPILDAYIRELARDDDEDAELLLPKMTHAELAQAAFIRQDYREAVKLWTPLAENGDIYAAAAIGSLYQHDLSGIPKDYSKAFYWRHMAASEGDGESQEALGDLYALGQGTSRDSVEAYVWLNLALKQAKSGAFKGGVLEEIQNKVDVVAADLSAVELEHAKTVITSCTSSNLKDCN